MPYSVALTTGGDTCVALAFAPVRFSDDRASPVVEPVGPPDARRTATQARMSSFVSRARGCQAKTARTGDFSTLQTQRKAANDGSTSPSLARSTVKDKGLRPEGVWCRDCRGPSIWPDVSQVRELATSTAPRCPISLESAAQVLRARRAGPPQSRGRQHRLRGHMVALCGAPSLLQSDQDGRRVA